MQYRPLAGPVSRSALPLDTLLLGASMGNSDHDDSIRIIQKALDGQRPRWRRMSLRSPTSAFPHARAHPDSA